MFSNFFLKSFRILLLPFALLYWLGIAIRNWLYDKRILESTSFGLPLICVGNLSVGGTGKSPMVEYLVANLKNKFKVATLSRGYKRKTRGYALADEKTTALEIGDEPMQFHLKFPEVPVAVGEERILAIPQLLHDRPETKVIILDDAFQHRTVKAGLNILQKLIKEINPLPGQLVFFTAINYSRPYHIISKMEKGLDKKVEILLVTGIANPRPLKKLLEEHSNTYQMLQYADHHIFTIDDLKEIKQAFNKIDAGEKVILTTEKDAVRLLKFSDEIKDLPFYVVPVRHQFLFQEESKFDQLVSDFVLNFKKED